MPDLVLRTPARKVVLFIVLVVVMTLASVVTLFSEYAPFGILGILFFGVLGSFAAYKQLRDRTVVRGTPTALQIVGTDPLPWHNVESIGVAMIPGGPRPMPGLGVRIGDLDQWTASLSESGLKGMRRAAKAGRMLGCPPAKGDPAVWVPAVMRWTRDMSGGYDLTVPPLRLPAPAEQVVEQVRGYAQQVAPR
ncbi:hypothetical protein G9U51_05850 [Calidifontibacter sp. DB0510]|uniref:Uncharacterized protein n=1 Tax=Metallococcus carri TaxID=1656884 RepID=A0A967E8K2_9MICO|nr:hypothetical protein [Metallococcus carri]NHN55307.1 hypothetical protein [Metallococcus carri]NOP36384.1 hypothetical protein [Calidifontibacter sp. DB2511S]